MQLLLRVALMWILGSLIIFFAVRLIPGDALSLRSRYTDPRQVEESRRELGLDQPVWVQYPRMLADFVSGNWGRGLITGKSVADELPRRLAATIELTLAALMIGTLVGIALSVLGKATQIRWLKQVPLVLALTGLLFPLFWLGLLAIYIGATSGWFPTGGRYSVALSAPDGPTGLLLLDSALAGDIFALSTALHHLVLPASVLALFPAALVCAVLNARLKDDRASRLIVALQARGIGPVRLWCWHILVLCLPPVVVILGTQFGLLLGGAVITETVFSWPGIGLYLVQAVLDRDLFIIQNAMLMLLAITILLFALSDWLAGTILPGHKGGDSW